MAENRFPPGWDEARVERLIAHYETQSDADVVAEDEATLDDRSRAAMAIPTDLVPAVRELIAEWFRERA